MRKEYVKEFNNICRFKNLKRYRDNSFYEKCLHKFIKKYLLNEENKSHFEGVSLEKEGVPRKMLLTLGSFLYPTEMKHL
jgi:hypothetical protein